VASNAAANYLGYGARLCLPQRVQLLQQQQQQQSAADVVKPRALSLALSTL